MKQLSNFFLFVVIIFVGTSGFVIAEEFSSNDFSSLNPVLFPGIYSTSTDYRAFSVISQIAIGTSTATSFNSSAGFLYFPEVTNPVVTATPGAARVNLSWTASEGFLGWTVSEYNIGQSTSPGGPYTYTDVGNVTSSTHIGLGVGTTYYFIVRVEDAFGNVIATSTEVSAIPTAIPITTPQDGGPILGKVLVLPLPTFITGKAITIPGCMRSDLDCDNKVSLKDLSILLAQPEKITNRALSLLFADWTGRLPVVASNGVLPHAIVYDGKLLKSSPDFAQLTDVVQSVEEIPETEPFLFFKSALKWIGGLFKAVGSFILKLFRS